MACDPEILKRVSLFALLDDDETAVLAAQVELKQFTNPLNHVAHSGNQSSRPSIERLT